MAFFTESCFVEVDGASLYTVIALPQEEGRFPVVLYRTPYVDALEQATDAEIESALQEGQRLWLEAGYAVVLQHCRGTGRSSGDCIPYIYERADGLALQEWVRAQNFYNGEIFLCGGSYLSSVHYVTAPFAADIKGAVLSVQDTERYNICYRNGYFKSGLHGGWYVKMYKKKTIREKNYAPDSFRLLPLSDFSRVVLGEESPDLGITLASPHRDDPFWQTHMGGADARDAMRDPGIPVLLTTHFYDIYTGGVFDMWKKMAPASRAMCALAVSPYDHSGRPAGQPVDFGGASLHDAYAGYEIQWMDAVRGKAPFPFEQGKVTYYRLFDGAWGVEENVQAEKRRTLPLGAGEESYLYNPYAPASFKGGLSLNFGGTAYQDAPNSRYDIKSFYTPPFAEDCFVKGQITARLRVRSDCEDTCFYMRLSLEKPEGDYGLRDDIHSLSEFCPEYVPGQEAEIEFVFDEHAFKVQKGERLRVDVSSSAYPHFVPHTNRRGPQYMQTTAKAAHNTLLLDASSVTLPVE